MGWKENEANKLFDRAKECERSNLDFKSKKREMESIEKHHKATDVKPKTGGQIMKEMLDKKIRYNDTSMRSFPKP